MKHKIYLFFISILLTSVVSCRFFEPKYENIIIGSYCGMCYNHCSIMIMVKNNSNKIDTSDFFFQTKNYNYFENNEGVNQSIIPQKELIGLINLLPDNLNKYPEKIGCPDCVDQCGILIKFSNKIIYLDPEDHPKEFDQFEEKLNKIVNQLRSDFY
ncbi:hypothetical protein FRY74_07545 [Vicingus serpentipes]|uniref:Uncharacterized protein n=1 Tax=Vicingus serpentipes TaxID=1926625 RepID=A0A5C6RT12_9FLAO|nr:hypothetical protein [Vicingus serpentipes]TXB65267.1 hypothetical protein FRY74_07545 [Vicingus serpentipes]